MPEIIYYVAASADGFIATADGAVEWLSAFQGLGDYGYEEFYSSTDALLIGRTTYEQVLTFGDWPYAGKPTWVLSHTDLPHPPAEVTVSALEPSGIARRLDAAGVSRAWLVGGGELAGSFARAGLISSYIISVMPVFLGEGIRLLGSSGASVRLRLESSTPFGDVVQLVYRPTGDA